MDNRETELELVSENKREEFCRKKNMKIQSDCETMRKMLVASKVKLSAAVKNKSEHQHRRQNIG